MYMQEVYYCNQIHLKTKLKHFKFTMYSLQYLKNKVEEYCLTFSLVDYLLLRDTIKMLKNDGLSLGNMITAVTRDLLLQKCCLRTLTGNIASVACFLKILSHGTHGIVSCIYSNPSSFIDCICNQAFCLFCRLSWRSEGNRKIR